MPLSMTMAETNNSLPPERIQDSPRLRRFFAWYQGVKKLAIALSLGLIWWSAAFGPLKEYVFVNIWSLLGFALMVLSIPVMFYVVFPAPFSGRYAGETAEEEMARERVKLVFLVLICASISARLFFLADEGLNIGSEKIGYAVLAIPALIGGWLLRRQQLRVLKACWRIIVGKKH